MDSTTGGVLGIFAFLISSGGIIYTAINHKRVRCKCCGKDVDMSVDVDSTMPVKKKGDKDKLKEKGKSDEESKLDAAAGIYGTPSDIEEPPSDIEEPPSDIEEPPVEVEKKKKKKYSARVAPY